MNTKIIALICSIIVIVTILSCLIIAQTTENIQTKRTIQTEPFEEVNLCVAKLTIVSKSSIPNSENITITILNNSTFTIKTISLCDTTMWANLTRSPLTPNQQITLTFEYAYNPSGPVWGIADFDVIGFTQ